MKKLQDLAYSAKHDQKLDVYLPDSTGFRTIVYFHGGGLEKGDKASSSMVEIAERLCESGYGVVSANYRMYPQAAFPDFLIDAADAVAFTKAHLREWGAGDELMIGGKSAGAWLTLMLCMDEHYLKDVGIDPHEIVGWISDSAQTTAHFNVQKYEQGEHKHAQRINEYAPQFFVGEETDFSHMLLIFYENDMPCRPQQNMLYYQSILTFRPEADVETCLLPGKHCQGSSKKDEDGEYPFVKVTLDWLRRKEL